jgi:hypothetical protein
VAIFPSLMTVCDEPLFLKPYSRLKKQEMSGGHDCRWQSPNIMSKLIAFVFTAIALAGCCTSGTGCDTPVASSPAEWDGLAEPPHDEAPKKDPRRKKEMAVVAQQKGDTQIVSRPQTKEEWERQQAADRADEARLTKKLKICTGCSAAPEKADDAVDSIRR